MDLERRLQETMADTYRIERELGGGGMSRVFAATESWAARPSMGLARARASLGVMAYFAGEVGEDVARAQRRGLAEYQVAPAAAGDRDRLVAFLDGMIAYTARRPADIDSARERLRTLTGDECAAYLDRALGAFALDLAGRRAVAGDSLGAIERERGGATM